MIWPNVSGTALCSVVSSVLSPKLQALHIVKLLLETPPYVYLQSESKLCCQMIHMYLNQKQDLKDQNRKSKLINVQPQCC